MGMCMSLLGLGGVNIEFPGDEVAKKTVELLSGLPGAVDREESDLKTQWAAAKEKGEDCKVLGGKDNEVVIVVIPKDAEEKEIRKAAYKVCAKGKFAAEVAEQVWSSVEPQIDSQKPDTGGNPVLEQGWTQAKRQVQKQVEESVRKQVEAECDKLMAAS